VAQAAEPGAIAHAARVLRRGEKVAIVLGQGALRAAPLAHAHAIASATGARLMAQTSNARIERGAGRHAIDRIPYPIDQALAFMADIQHVILVGAKKPVGFFAYPNKPGYMYPDSAEVHVLARVEHDLPATLAALAAELDAKPVSPAAGSRGEPGRGAVTSEGLGASLSALLPEGAIVADESVSFGRGLYPGTHHAAPHDWLQLTGGAIGEGLPLATGAAVACPDRRVVTLQADGSAMYTVQALWTQAREKLDVTTVILANRKYAILLGELAGVGANPGRVALDMMDLGNPDLDWVKIAGGMGVEAAKASTMEEFNDLFVAANKRRGPFVIELVI
jgi:acetolactate synthase-1/2/3 large subunit